MVSSLPSWASLVVKLKAREKLSPLVAEAGVKVMLMAPASEPPAATVPVVMAVAPKLALVVAPWVRAERVSGPVPLFATV